MESRGSAAGRLARMLFDENWSDWLPIYAWVVVHDEGIILVDTGETAAVHQKGYHPSWHPFYRRAVRFSVHPEEEIGPQLKALGIAARDIRHVVLTHLHTDHAGGLMHLTGSQIWVSRQEWQRATGPGAKLLGYVPHRLPKWLDPEFICFRDTPVGPFARSMPLTQRGDVRIIPTPGHTPHHISVLVIGSPSYFIAGDSSYNQELLLAGKVDGVSPDQEISLDTLNRIKRLAKERPLVYLPSHDQGSQERLTRNSVLVEKAETTEAAVTLLSTCQIPRCL
jgi:N-acyl homoserine lactone hydrolase